MLKISSKKSVLLSIIASCFLFAGCIVCAVILPSWVNVLINARGEFASSISRTEHALIVALAYNILAIVVLANCLLISLLLRVRRALVFTHKSVGRIRGISWCCFLLSAVFFVLGFYFMLSFVMAFFAIFLGMCIRVVKNVIEQAVEIKCENDLTV